jgi:hypothetical protein
MIRRLLLLTIAAAIVLALHAAPAAAQPRFGIRAGWVSSDLRGDPPSGPFLTTDFSSRSGVTAGAFARFDLATHLELQVEAAYAHRGAEGTVAVTVPQLPLGPGGQGVGQRPVAGTRAALSVRPKVDLLQVPVLLRYVIGDGSTRPALFAGPAIAFKLAASMEAGVPGGYRPGDFDLVADIGDDVRSTNFGLVFGVGADIDVGSGQLVLDARYDLGLTEVFEDGTRFPGYRPCCDPDGVFGIVDRGDLRWSAFTVGVGYVF